MLYIINKLMEELQTYLTDFFLENLIFPSFEQICEKFGWASKNSAYKKMQLLVDVGILRKIRGSYGFNPEKFNIKLYDKVKQLELIEQKEETEYWKKKKEYYQRIGSPC